MATFLIATVMLIIVIKLCTAVQIDYSCFFKGNALVPVANNLPNAQPLVIKKVIKSVTVSKTSYEIKCMDITGWFRGEKDRIPEEGEYPLMWGAWISGDPDLEWIYGFWNGPRPNGVFWGKINGVIARWTFHDGHTVLLAGIEKDRNGIIPVGIKRGIKY